MHCKNCGKQVADGAAFCDGCGSRINDAASSKEAEDNKIFFMLSYLGILFFLPLVITPNSKIGRFHANQGLILLITSVVGQIVLSILSVILWKIWFLVSLISGLWGLALFALVIIGMVNAYKGETKPLPVIGNIILLK
jgi:uncharacterized membrane protein